MATLEKHPNPKIAYTVAAALIIALAGGAYAFSRMNAEDTDSPAAVGTTATPTASQTASPSASASTSASATPIPSTAPSATPDLTTGWKSSSELQSTMSAQGKFTVKYPSDWKIARTTVQADTVTDRISTGVRSGAANPTASGEYDITFSDGATSSYMSGRSDKKLGETQITVDGKTFTRITYGTTSRVDEILYTTSAKGLPFTEAFATLPAEKNADYVRDYDLLMGSIAF